MSEPITNVRELVRSLGGVRAMPVGPQTVSWWRKRNQVPAKYKDWMLAKLEARGLSAPAALWSSYEEPVSDPN